MKASAKELWPPLYFCAICHAPYRFSYRALGAKCENTTCKNVNDGSGRRFWISRSDLAAATPRPAPLETSASNSVPPYRVRNEE